MGADAVAYGRGDDQRQAIFPDEPADDAIVTMDQAAATAWDAAGG